jgi:hypothetical protein
MRGLALALSLVLLAAPVAAQDFTLFQSPTGNIGCMAVADPGDPWVECELGQRNPGPPALPRPRGCDLDWGSRFGVGSRGEAWMGCHGDTIRDRRAAVLPYGSSLRFGAVTCTSRETGMECRNDRGAGFVLSRARQRLF